MTKQFFYCLLASIIATSCAKKAFFRKEMTANPGYYEQWLREHKNENGEIPTDVVQRWYAQDQAQIAQERGGNTIIATATNLGASIAHGGRTRAILVSSADTSRIFVGSVSGGLWRSDNAGVSWSAINDQTSNLSVTCITENPFNPKEIYYGTGEIRGSAGPSGNGIYKSEDGGLTFNLLASTGIADMRYCNFIEHSRVDSSIVWVGTTRGLFYTKDSGKNWTKMPTSFGSSAVSRIISFPDSSVMVSVLSNRIYKSPKGHLGVFTAITEPTFPTSGLGHILIANCRAVPNTIYAWFTTNEYLAPAGTDKGVFRTDDGGLTWARTSPDVIKTGSAQQLYCQMLGVHPKNPNYVMVGAQSAAYSRNGGLNWTTCQTGHADNHVAYPAGNSTYDVFMGNDGGIYRGNWQTLAAAPKDMSKTYANSQYYAGNFGLNGQTCVGGTQDNGSWRYINGALSKMAGADGAYAHLSQQEPNLGYYSIQNGETYRKDNFSNNGSSFTITPPTAIAEGVDFINQYEINYVDGKQLYYRTNKGILRSTDKGNTWQKLNSKTITSITAIGVSNEKDPSVYVGGSGTFYRIDSAATRKPNAIFTNMSAKLPAPLKLNSWGTISMHPTNNSVIFVGLSSMSSASRAWKAVNANTDSIKWIDITGNLPAAMSIYQIQPHPDAPDSVLLAATAFGLYYSTNNGKIWTKETRVPNVIIFEMKLRAKDKNVFLFTHGRGVWHLTLGDLKSPVSAQDVATTLWKVYPNPTSQVLQIEGDAEIGNLQVFDLTGRELLRTKNSASIDVSILNKGIYLIKIFDKSGRFATQKFVKE